MQLDKAIKTRRSIRNYSKKKPDWREIIEAIDKARYAPMAGNLFTPRFILVKDSEKIEKITNATQQTFCNKAQYIVVVCSDKKLPKNSFGERADRYCRQQAGAAIQNFLLKINELGLATCWIGHFVDNQIKQILKIPDECDIEALFPIGYAKEIKRPVFKTELDNCLFFEEFGQKKMKPHSNPRV